MREWLARVRDWLRRGQLERELLEELRFHREHLERDALNEGVPAQDAARTARVRLGNVIRITEAARERWSLPTLDQFQQDVRYALRGLRRSPGFSLTAILTLALGIGANAVMFGVVDRLMFRPYPYLRDPGNVHLIYLLETGLRERRIHQDGLEYRRYLDLARHTTSFSEVAAFAYPMMAIGAGEAARERRVAAVSGTFWSMFDARPVLGRFFTQAEETPPHGAEVAVLGYGFWQSELGGRNVIGERLPMGPMSPTIIGIAPRGFTGVFDAEEPVMFIPITLYVSVTLPPADWAGFYTTYARGWLSVMARRKPGITLDQASTDASQAYWRSWEAERTLRPDLAPASEAQPAAIVSALKTAAGPDPTLEQRTALWLLGVAGIVLLIACANVANLFLARALKRQREIAIRLALGISRSRLALQTLLESLILALISGVAALLVAHWLGAATGRLLLNMEDPPIVLADPRTLAAVFGIGLVAAVLTGMAPAFLSGRRDLTTALKSGVREGSSIRSRMRDVLVVVQGALSVVLLVGAALFVSSLQRVRGLRMGYNAENTLIVQRNLRGTILDSAQLVESRRRLLEAAQAIPGVTHTAWLSSVPFGETGSTGIHVPGVDSIARFGQFSYQLTTPGYFPAMGTQLLRGRGFTDADKEGAPRVAVVSESMARTLWPQRDPLGQCIKLANSWATPKLRSDTAPCTTVVGVAEDIVQRENQLGAARRLHYYLPIEQVNPQRGRFVLVRMRGDAAAQQDAVRMALQRLMPGNAYVTVRPLLAGVENARRSWRLGATLFVAFGLLALAVAAIGLYGVVAYNVTQRRHELGIRVALGAQRADIVRLVMAQSARFATIGVLVGSALAFGISPAVQPLLFRQSARDPAIYTTIGIIMLVVALLAAAVPALRATRADPNRALRAD